MNLKLAALLMSAFLFAGLDSAYARAASITALGFDREPHDVSNGGSVVVGEFYHFAPPIGPFVTDLFIWKQSSGFVQQNVEGVANSVTPDGLVAVGWQKSGTFSSGPPIPFRWTQATGRVSLGMPPGAITAEAFGASADGSVVMVEGGRCGGGGCTFQDGGSIFRWTQAGGYVPLGFSALGRDVSADGSVIVGRHSVQINASTAATQAFRWSEATGVVGLGTLNGDLYSDANAVSADGSVVVGGSYGGHAFRWTEATGMIDMGPGVATDISADGSIIVGTGAAGAFYWSQASGMRPLLDVLQNDYGLDMTDWSLESALAISPDGRTIVGHGFGPLSYGIWMVNIAVPEPSSLLLEALAGLALLCRRRSTRRVSRLAPTQYFRRE